MINLKYEGSLAKNICGDSESSKDIVKEFLTRGLVKDKHVNVKPEKVKEDYHVTGYRVTRGSYYTDKTGKRQKHSDEVEVYWSDGVVTYE